MNKKKRELKFQKGTKHWVKQQSGLPCIAEVIDTRPDAYYVHYCNFDKRLDEWVGFDRFLSAEQTKALGEAYFSDSQANGLQRNLRRRFSDSFTQLPAPIEDQLEREHQEATKVKNIHKITLGCWEIDCWYFSPFPDTYAQAEHLFFCERCLKYMRFKETLGAHLTTCQYNGPPGTLLYLEGGVAVWECDGRGSKQGEKLYCQNMCLLAKLFLDHKTIYYDVAPFLFYILCEVDSDGVHPVGFFSKEKESTDNYNLACIMVLPPHQRKGYGRFLMALSYEISRREGKQGSPEKPLSDLGLVSYRRFWIRELLLKLDLNSTVESLAIKLGFTIDDVRDSLESIGLLKGGKVVFNARHIRELLNEHYAFKQGCIEFVSSALSWPPSESE